MPAAFGGDSDSIDLLIGFPWASTWARRRRDGSPARTMLVTNGRCISSERAHQYQATEAAGNCSSSQSSHPRPSQALLRLLAEHY